MTWKHKLFFLILAIVFVVSTTWFSWQQYQTGVRDGKLRAEDGYLVLDAEATEGEIKIAEEGEAGLYIDNEKAEELGLVYYPGTFTAPTCIVFHGDSDTEIGRLEWDTGKFVFVGEAEESALVFFEHFLKPYVDAYIASNLEKETKLHKDLSKMWQREKK